MLVVVLGERHVPRVYLEDLEPALLVRDLDLDLAVEASWPSQGRVDGVGPVGRRYDDDLASCLEPVHEREQLADDSALHLSGDLLSLWSDRVDLVDEYDGRCLLLCFLEDLAEPRLGLAVELAHDLRSADWDEVRVALGRDRLGQQGLAGAGRAVEQHSLRRLDAELLEYLRVAERELNHLPDFLDLVLQAADVLVGDLGDSAEGLSLFGDHEDRPLGDQGGLRDWAHARRPGRSACRRSRGS